jgi:predicted RNase H-like HicB family nuclease
MTIRKGYILSRFKLNKDGVDYEFETAEEGGYVVRVPLYPSCVSEGDTFEEALLNIEDALLGCLLTARDHKLPIPPQLEPFIRQTAKS